MSGTMERVIRIVKPLAAAEVDEVSAETRIVDDLDVASADLVDVVLELEKEFGVRIRDEETVGLETIGDVCELIEGKTAGEAAPG